MEIEDTLSMVIRNSKARAELKMDAKRKRIVRKDLGFNTLPRMEEFISMIPCNFFLGRSLDGGRVIDYQCLGDGADWAGMKTEFSIKAYTELLLYVTELSRMILDAISAMKMRSVSSLSFYDCSGGSLSSFFGMMECEFWGWGGGGVERERERRAGRKEERKEERKRKKGRKEERKKKERKTERNSPCSHRL